MHPSVLIKQDPSSTTFALTEDLQVNWDEDFVSKSGAPGFLRGVSFVGHLIGRGLLSHELVRHHLFKPLTVHYYNKDNHVKQSIRANAIYRLFTAAEHRSFPCPGCGREFGSKDAMDQHYNTEHYFERSEFDEFTTERARDQHHDAVHHWIECPECDREFKTKEAMDQHYSVKHRPKCSVCFNEFTTVAAMKQHYNAQHQLKCPDCSSYFTTESARDQVRFFPVIP
ncbi:hypothetical protein BDM02DRAFT_3188622 [Thelephora ganbajun]|uniref:Uncharacterized protein n=1 Tax=Thelephora ganbajun TaxID=370292 RepID=A0ACB6ZAN2_THEGA|nr:hypothetical protein BDM02DRAFT_3188622 [Thelephora ganbajun]